MIENRYYAPLDVPTLPGKYHMYTNGIIVSETDMIVNKEAHNLRQHLLISM